MRLPVVAALREILNYKYCILRVLSIEAATGWWRVDSDCPHVLNICWKIVRSVTERADTRRHRRKHLVHKRAEERLMESRYSERSQNFCFE